MSDSDSELEQLLPENAGENIDPEEELVTVRRSSRLANKAPSPLISDWPPEKILATLYSRNIQAPLGIDHEELFQLFLEKVEILQMPATPTPSGTKKATAKRKHCSRSSNAPAPKKSTERSVNISELQPAQDPVMTALQSIQLSISNLDTRIQMLENRPSSSTITMAITSPSLAPTAPDAAAALATAALATASASGFTGSSSSHHRSPFFPTCCCHLSPDVRSDPRR
ncbi:hypothetical protein ABG768_018559 [Culter alburnus]|uniref:Uncharacterized protein n=1 Tax=Culter alburnus TaxID=194366 RepID=A0AAW1YW00_CULAL